jgi:hypothetical protein
MDLVTLAVPFFDGALNGCPNFLALRIFESQRLAVAIYGVQTTSAHAPPEPKRHDFPPEFQERLRQSRHSNNTGHYYARRQASDQFTPRIPAA